MTLIWMMLEYFVTKVIEVLEDLLPEKKNVCEIVKGCGRSTNNCTSLRHSKLLGTNISD